MPDGSPAVLGVSSHCSGAEVGAALIEVLVATLVLTSGLLAMAQLLSIAVSTNAAAKSMTVATILADQKIEQLHAATDLQPSPADALQRSTTGFADHVDASGAVVGEDAQAPPGAAYTRRWLVVPLSDGEQLLVRVRVMPIAFGTLRDGRVPGEARAVAVRVTPAR